MSLSLPYQEKVLSRDQVVDQARRWQAEGLCVVFTNGCFDLLHVGHIQTLVRAKHEGDRLIVGLNSDASVASLKGADRPITCQGDRATVLAALACVDAVTIFEENTPVALLEALQPNVHVKGGDYRLEDLPEAEVVQRGGGRVVLIDLVEGRSTTSMIARTQRPA